MSQFLCLSFWMHSHPGSTANYWPKRCVTPLANQCPIKKKMAAGYSTFRTLQCVICAECVDMMGSGGKTKLYGLLLRNHTASTCDTNSKRDSGLVPWPYIPCFAGLSPQLLLLCILGNSYKRWVMSQFEWRPVGWWKIPTDVLRQTWWLYKLTPNTIALTASVCGCHSLYKHFCLCLPSLPPNRMFHSSQDAFRAQRL